MAQSIKIKKNKTGYAVYEAHWLKLKEWQKTFCANVTKKEQECLFLY